MERRQLMLLGGSLVALCFLIPIFLQIWFFRHKVVHVVLIAGDDNVLGYAQLENLQQFMDNVTIIENENTKNDEKEERKKKRMERYDHLKDPITGNWSTRDDVFIFSERKRHEPWQIGPLNIYDYGAGPGLFGPEFEIGHVLGEAFDEPVVLVKAGFGRKTLAQDWRSPSRIKGAAGKDKAAKTLGYAWIHTLHDLQYALEHVTDVLPHAYRKHRTQLTGIIWWHGYSDVLKSQNLNTYEHNLKILLQDFRKTLDRPHLPIVVAEAGAGGQIRNGTYYSFEMPLRTAQKNVCQAMQTDPATADTTKCTATSAFQAPGVTKHLDRNFHYFGSGNGMIEIGSVLGSSLVELYYRQYENEELQEELEANYDNFVSQQEFGVVTFLLLGVLLMAGAVYLIQRRNGSTSLFGFNWNRLFFVSAASSDSSPQQQQSTNGGGKDGIMRKSKRGGRHRRAPYRDGNNSGNNNGNENERKRAIRFSDEVGAEQQQQPSPQQQPQQQQQPDEENHVEMTSLPNNHPTDVPISN